MTGSRVLPRIGGLPLALILGALLAGAPTASAALPVMAVTKNPTRIDKLRRVQTTVTVSMRTVPKATVLIRADLGKKQVVLTTATVRPIRATTRAVVVLRGPTGRLKVATHRLIVCVRPATAVGRKRARGACKLIGTLKVRVKGAPVFTPVPAPKPSPSTPAPAPTTGRDQPVPAPCGAVNCAPAAIPAREQPFAINDALGRYWAFVPTDYTPATPARLLVWLHGCGGESAGDLYTVGDYYDDQRYIAIAPDGAEGGCWNMDTGPRRVRTAVADAIARFNVDPRRVVIGGYSSGGDLSYRTAFYNARTFAGLLAINTSPFRDTGSSAASSIAAAAWRFPVVHVAHTADGTYPVAGVASEITMLKNAGFPVTFIERPGTHYDPNPGEPGHVAGQPSTDQEIQSLLVPRMKDDWTSPAP